MTERSSARRVGRTDHRYCFHSTSTRALNAIPRALRTRRSSLYDGLLGDGACRARTGDLLLAKQALSQLS
jgi:hypothetical protein